MQHKKKGQKLGQKNLNYSILLVGVLLAFLIVYMISMLPSLYVDHRMQANLESVKKQHMEYVKTGSYENVQVENPVACFSIKIPKEENTIYVVGKQFSFEIALKEDSLKELLDDFRRLQINDVEDESVEDLTDEREKFEQKFADCMENLQGQFEKNEAFKISGEIFESYQDGTAFCDEYTKYHQISNQCVIVEAGISDRTNYYTTYLALENAEDAFIISILPVMQPQMDEIRSVVLESMPMIAGVILLLVLLFSQVYSKGIVAPIEALVCHTRQMKNAEHFEVSPLPEKYKNRGDEVGTLAETMDELYLEIRKNYEALEEKNEELAEENKRQEIFLRASSHQLKTPISAALLLLDGMIGEIGKYKDTAKYLPEVKKQLLSMRKMVEEILYLNHCGDEIHMVSIEVRELFEKRLKEYQIAIQNKELQIQLSGMEKMFVSSDETILTQVIDNLLSNAINATPEKEKVTMTFGADKIQIRNYGTNIPEEILPNIFEPFVTGNPEKKSHGLGLYLVSYYAKRLGIRVGIDNEENAVLTEISFSQDEIAS